MSDDLFGYLDMLFERMFHLWHGEWRMEWGWIDWMQWSETISMKIREKAYGLWVE